ncbi:Reverse transcriptase (RNA-dependent DNA polymerase) [Fragilaria crotonensis]|nr:Reverse transcriptase (RNA-dependent DNA polymerase) [Fragilaria crotonensis]
MYSTHEADLDLPCLPPAARRVHIVPALQTASLLSMGQLCDAGCEVTFDATTVSVRHNHTLLLHGKRLPHTGLWHLDLSSTPVPCAPPTAPPNVHRPYDTMHSVAAVAVTTPADLVAFAHASLFSPALSTLKIALDRGFLPDFQGLTAKALTKYQSLSVPMIKGHLDQSRKNQRSTQRSPLAPTDTPPVPASIDDATTNDLTELANFPESDPNNTRTHHCFAAVVEPATGQIHTDQTGRFVVASSTGNNYILVLYDYDSNSILVEPMLNRTGACILNAFQVLHARLVTAGLKPQLQRLDNECSTALKTFLTNESIDYQLVPPGLHRRNAAERAIRTFKNHFIAGLCSVDKKFPLHLWDKLLPQAETTLNLLRGSRINPKLSAYAQLHGHFDYNRTPMAPPGIRVLVHVKPQDRTTWSPHGEDGWYTGPAFESYRCSRVAPLPTTHHDALLRLTDILTSIVSSPPTSSLAPAPPPADRAAPPPLSAPPTTEPHPDPSLRVLAVPTTPDDPALRVPTPIAPIIPRRTVQFAPLPSDIIVATFSNSTGLHGKRRRKAQRTRAPQRPLSASQTIHPNKRPTVAPPPSPPVPATSPPNLPARRHSHGTRLASRLRHISAAARNVILAAARVGSHPAAPSHHYALHGNAFNPDTGKLAEYRELSQCSEGHLWQQSNADKIGRLAQGHGDQKGTNTMFFINIADIPKGRKDTYLRVVAATCPEKVNPRRVRWTVGGDCIEYPDDVSTKTADLTTAKLLINSTISTPNARYMTADLKDFYLGTPMTRYEYMRIPIDMLPAAIIEQYNLRPLFHNGHVYVEIRRGMYGLPQAGRLANNQLIAFLAPHGYHPVPLTPGLWRHNTKDIVFSLVVDDFGIRYTSRPDAEHLIATLESMYQVSTDWTGSRYCGLTLQWDYVARTCDVSMPGYIERALHRFQHPAPTKPEHSPHPWQKPTYYGAKTQFAIAPDTTTALDATDKRRILEVLGTLLYYARAIDSTLLTAIGELATEQSEGTKTTMEKLAQLLNYCATHPDATVQFTASDMLLAVESGASYLSVVKARSRAAGCFYLTNAPTTPTAALKPNGAIHVLCHIMREVLSSAAEAELGALFHNGKEACPLRIALEEMGHPQPATPMATDNNTASGIATDTVKQKQIQSNRHAFLLDSRSCPPRPVQNLLEQRPNQPCRLFF